MLNPFKIKKHAAFLLAGFLPAITFHITFITNGFLWACVGLALSMVIMSFIGCVLIKNPFSSMLEGKGVLALNIDSTGIITPFLVQIAQPFLKGDLKGESVRDVFDRNAVMTMKAPVCVKRNQVQWKEGALKVELDEDLANRSRFGFFQFPCLIYNKMIGSFITKDFLSEKENGTFANHQVLYMNRQMEELSSSIRDFSRSVVEHIKPVKDLFKSSWFWILIIIVGIIMAALLGPKIIAVFQDQLGGSLGSAVDAVSTVSPRG